MKGEVPFVRIVLPMIAGILLGNISDILGFRLSVGCFIFLAVAFTFQVVFYRPLAMYRLPVFPGILLTLMIISGTCALTAWRSSRFAVDHFSRRDAAALIGIVKDEPIQTSSYNKMVVDVIGGKVGGELTRLSGKLMLYIRLPQDSTGTSARYGDVIIIPGRTDTIPEPLNPGEFNYRAYLEKRQIFRQQFIDQFQFKVLDSGAANSMVAASIRTRANLVSKFERWLEDPESAALASTLILGYRADLSEELVTAYARTGTTHVLSVSGMHVAIVFIVLMFVLRFMDARTSLRILRAVIIIMAIWYYAMITGFSAPACRAAFMLSFLVFGKGINRSQNTYNLVSISAVFLLLYNPYFLFDVGFLLSYLAVLGLVYFHPKIASLTECGLRSVDSITSYCAVSLSAQLTTSPLSILIFHQFPIYFLLSNLVIVLPVAVIMYIGILFMFVTSDFLLKILGTVLNELIKGTNAALYSIEKFPFATADGLWIDALQCMILYLIIAVIVAHISFGYRKLFRDVSILTAVFLMVSTFHLFGSYLNRRMTFLSIRDHVGILLEDRGRKLFIGTVQPGSTEAQRVVLPAAKVGNHSMFSFISYSNVEALPWVVANNGFVSVRNHNILIWTPATHSPRSTRITVDFLVVAGNPRTSLKTIAERVDFKKVIIGANNSEYRIRAWEKEAKLMRKSFYSLKYKPAFVQDF